MPCNGMRCSPQVLACDALYLAAGLGAYTVKRYFDFEAWFQAFLGPALEALVGTMRARPPGPEASRIARDAHIDKEIECIRGPGQARACRLRASRSAVRVCLVFDSW